MTIMKTLCIMGLFFVLSCGFIKAQFPNPLDFNTSTNATNTGTLSYNSNDLHWSVALTSSVGPFVPAVVCGNQAPCCWINSPYSNANWITYPHTCSSSPAEHSCLGNVDEYYRLVINLPDSSCSQAIGSPSAYCLSFDFYADNWVSEIFVNNVLTYYNPSSDPYNEFGFSSNGGLTASLCNNWQAGANTVLIHVASSAPTYPGWTGFLAQANQTVNTVVGNPLSASVSQTATTCGGSASVNANGGGGNYTYTWMPNGGNSALASNLLPGTYSVMVHSASGCAVTRTITIPQPDYNVTTSGNSTICVGAPITIVAYGANTYTWYPGNIQASSINVSPSVTTVYTINATTSSNCPTTNFCTVTAVSCTGFNTVSGEHDIKLYPNPGDGHFIVLLEQTTQVTLMDIFGKIVDKKVLNANTNELDLSHLDEGVYFIIGKTEQDHWQKKIIIKR
jgi:hypothetical protein